MHKPNWVTSWLAMSTFIHQCPLWLPLVVYWVQCPCTRGTWGSMPWLHREWEDSMILLAHRHHPYPMSKHCHNLLILVVSHPMWPNIWTKPLPLSDFLIESFNWLIPLVSHRRLQRQGFSLSLSLDHTIVNKNIHHKNHSL